MKMVMASAEHTGANIQHLTVAGLRIIDGKGGEKTVELHLTSIDPTTDILFRMSEAEAKGMRDEIAKLFPQLTSVKGSKS